MKKQWKLKLNLMSVFEEEKSSLAVGQLQKAAGVRVLMMPMQESHERQFNVFDPQSEKNKTIQQSFEQRGYVFQVIS